MLISDKFTLFEVLENSPYFPYVPKELSDIINMLQDPHSVNIDKLVDKIKFVENLEHMTLNFINSEFFKVNKKVVSLKEAIIFLGMTTMQVIIIATIINDLFSNTRDKSCEYKKRNYLKHSIGTALASISIADWLGESNKYELFAYGILHDIGVIVYERCFPDALKKIQEKMYNGCHQIVAERVVFGGVDHTDIGAWICKKLNFPPNISDVIISHHWPFKAKNQNTIIHIISLGDYISAKYYEGFLIRRNSKETVKIKINNSLNIPEDVLNDISANLPDNIEKTLKLLKRF